MFLQSSSFRSVVARDNPDFDVCNTEVKRMSIKVLVWAGTFSSDVHSVKDFGTGMRVSRRNSDRRVLRQSVTSRPRTDVARTTDLSYIHCAERRR